MAYVPVEADEKLLAELEEKHEDVLVIRGSSKAPWLLVVRRPKRNETILFKQQAKRAPELAAENLLRMITVHPDPRDKSSDPNPFDKQVDRWPFLCESAFNSDAFQEFLGLTVEAQVK